MHRIFPSLPQSSPVFPSLKRLFPVVIVSFVLSSCYSHQTKAPHQIDAIELTEENIYSKIDCDSLLEVREEEKDELIVLREKQVIKRQDDTMKMMNWGRIVGVIASRNAQDWEEEIGLSKGKLLAIQKEIDSRCLLDEEEKKDIMKRLVSSFLQLVSSFLQLVSSFLQLVSSFLQRN